MGGRIAAWKAGAVLAALWMGCAAGPAPARAVAAPPGAPVPRGRRPDGIAEKGLSWLVRTQHESGGWGQGDESAEMGGSADAIRVVPNVGDTCAAALALLGAGSTPEEGEHAERVRRAIGFVCGEVERSDRESLSVTSVQGTRLQAKLGPAVDTFLACAFLSEVRPLVRDEARWARAAAALDKVLGKMGRHQRPDGSFDNRGWAPVLAQGIAAKGFNRAAQLEIPVDEGVRKRFEEWSRAQFDRAAGAFRAAGSAGVDLYANAGNLIAMQEGDRTNALLEPRVRARLAAAKDPKERADGEAFLRRAEETRRDLGEARRAVARRLEEPGFVAGFGSNGGEEFLSYLNVAECLAAAGGEPWERWRAAMAENLARVQNADGSWSGHHCITGRTFCTAAALLILSASP